MKKTLATLLTMCGLIAPLFAQGTILWSETVNGPLSQFSSAPTELPPMQAGTNSILGQAEIEPIGNNWLAHDDFFTLQKPIGFHVASARVQLDKPNVWLWLGDPKFVNQSAFVSNPSTGNLLFQWGLASLSNGSYSMYVGNTDAQSFTSITNYRLDFFVQSIPEPSVLWLLLGGFAMFGSRKRKRERL